MIADVERFLRLVGPDNRLTPEGWQELMRIIDYIRALEARIEALENP